MDLRHCHGLHDAFGFVGVVAQEVHRFAHFAHCVAPGLVGFFNQECAEGGSLLQHGVSGAAQDGGALGHSGLAPLLVTGVGRIECAGGVLGIELGHSGHGSASQRCHQRGAHGGHGQVQPRAVLAGTRMGAKQSGGQRQAGMGLQAHG